MSWLGKEDGVNRGKVDCSWSMSKAVATSKQARRRSFNADVRDQNRERRNGSSPCARGQIFVVSVAVWHSWHSWQPVASLCRHFVLVDCAAASNSAWSPSYSVVVFP
jgi:hypothetical protein